MHNRCNMQAFASSSGGPGGQQPQRHRWQCTLCSCGFSKGSELATHLADSKHTLQLMTAGVGIVRSDLLLTHGLWFSELNIRLKYWNSCITSRTLLDHASGSGCLQTSLMPNAQWMQMLNSLNSDLDSNASWVKPLYIQLTSDDNAASSLAAAASLDPAPWLLFDSILGSGYAARVASALGPEAGKPKLLRSFVSTHLVPLVRQPPRTATRLAFASVVARDSCVGFRPSLHFLWLEAGPPVRYGRQPGQRCVPDPPGLLAAASAASVGPAGLGLGILCDPTVPEELEPGAAPDAIMSKIDNPSGGSDEDSDDGTDMRDGELDSDVDYADELGDEDSKASGARPEKRRLAEFRFVRVSRHPRAWRLCGFQNSASTDDIELALRRCVSFQWDQVISYVDFRRQPKVTGMPKSKRQPDPLCRVAVLTERSGLQEEALRSALINAFDQPELLRMSGDRQLVVQSCNRVSVWLPLGFGDGLADRCQFLLALDFATELPCTIGAALRQLQTFMPLARSFYLPTPNDSQQAAPGKIRESLEQNWSVARFDSHADCAKTLGLLTANSSFSGQQKLLCRFAALPDYVSIGPLRVPVHNCFVWRRRCVRSSSLAPGFGYNADVQRDFEPFNCDCHPGSRFCQSAASFNLRSSAALIDRRVPADATPDEARRIATECLLMACGTASTAARSNSGRW